MLHQKAVSLQRLLWGFLLLVSLSECLGFQSSWNACRYHLPRSSVSKRPLLMTHRTEIQKLKRENEYLRQQLESLQSNSVQSNIQPELRNGQIDTSDQKSHEMPRHASDANNEKGHQMSRQAEEERGLMRNWVFEEPEDYLENMLRPWTRLMRATSGRDMPVDSMEQMLRDALMPGRLLAAMTKDSRHERDHAMAEAHSDINQVQELTARIVGRDSAAASLLGSKIEVEAPFNRYYHSKTMNGKTSKHVSLQMPIKGSKASGLVAVDAKLGHDGGISLSRCSVQVGDRTVQVQCASKSQPGSASQR